MTANKAMIAMSGGVDSSVAAYLMKEAGYDCMGAIMRLYTKENPADGADSASGCQKICCIQDDAEDARSVAMRLAMPFYVFNFTEMFSQTVMKSFADSYMEGRTPNPCIECNRSLKFGRFLEKAEELGCEKIATGHYAQICQDEASGRYLLKRAADLSKDQSYVLYSMTQEELAHTCFPLGTMNKTQVRALAEEKGFVNARKHDSQDICFVPDGDYAAFIERFTGKTFEHGEFIDLSGKVLGEHKGLIHYTIGQRKGLGIAYSSPLYVIGKDYVKNRVILGPNEALFTKKLTASGMNWICSECPEEPLRVKAKVRYRHEPQWATVTPVGRDRMSLEFDEPQRAITAGQAVVLYDGDLVYGGGMIDADGPEI